MSMRVLAATALLVLVTGTSLASPAKTLTPQQQRMGACNTQATGKKGDERKAFMSSCLKG